VSDGVPEAANNWTDFVRRPVSHSCARPARAVRLEHPYARRRTYQRMVRSYLTGQEVMSLVAKRYQAARPKAVA
jgi:hypothetical protein